MTADARRPPWGSTTRQTLVRLRGWLLGVTAVTLATGLTVFLGVAGNADIAAERSVPAILASYDAQDALRNAHLAAVDNLSRGGVVLGGPGVEYQRQIAAAGQFLTLVAENNAARDKGTRDIQTIEALLVTYTGLIGQADARFRDAELGALGVAALREAASLLNDILDRLQDLRDKQRDALDAQADNLWTNERTTVVWLLPMVTLGVLLVWTQAYLTRRFRRTANVPLLLATAAVVGMMGLTGLSNLSADKLDEAQAGVRRVDGSRERQAVDVGSRAAYGLADQVEKQCGKVACVDTTAALRRSFPSPPPTPGAVAGGTNDAEVAANDALTNVADDAANSRRGEVLLPVLALVIAGLVLLGFQPRLAEYVRR
ncbi:hypothetical protein [Micromonospora sp. NPDC048839]|uniref:hypothetical protein n=1 Tax=Micromonospora sp. NPDC048839 TaxID=3155641 RepID=UPI0033CBB2D7